MAYYEDRTWTLEERGAMYRIRTATTTTTTATNCTATTITVNCYYSASNYQVYSVEEPPKVQPEYLALRRVVLSGEPRGQMPVGRCALAALPRGKLVRWKSLKEKRAAWGIT